MRPCVNRLALPVAGVALLATGAALAAAHVAVMVKSVQNPTLNTSILVNQTGRTLYHLTSEKGAKFVCTGGCTTVWPPLIVSQGAKPLAGPGIVKSKLGTIKRPGGGLQATYDSHPLYTYIGDSAPGQARGNKLDLNGGYWYEVRA